MVAKRSRSAHRNGKRKKQQRKWLTAGIAVLFVALCGFALFYSGIFSSNTATTTASNSSEVTSSVSTSTENTTTTTSEATTSSTSDVIWEKQESPVKIPILMYHAIHVMAEEESANANLIVDPTTFESHLQALQNAGYYTLTPEEAYKALTENVLPQGKKVVWLTFDDSLWDFYDIAYPLLKQYQMHATNNVITGTVGNSGNLSLEQMKEMKENGMSFQSHTVNHPDLEYSTPESQEYELTTSKQYLDSELSQDTIALAYPAGRYSDTTISLAEQAQYKLAVTTNEGLASAADGLLSLNRVRILPTTTADILLQAIAVE